jgi:hypothetical protein
MDELEIFLRLAFAGLGLILTCLTAASWVRTREPKIMLAALGFGVLAAEGLLLAFEVFSDDPGGLIGLPMLVGLNFIAMVFLYLSVLKR